MTDEKKEIKHGGEAMIDLLNQEQAELQKAMIELAQDMEYSCADVAYNACRDVTCFECLAKALTNLNYRKLPENAIILSKDEYKAINMDRAVDMLREIQNIVRKETAREVLDKVYDWGQGFFIEHSFMEEDEFNGILDEVKKLFLNVVEV